MNDLTLLSLNRWLSHRHSEFGIRTLPFYFLISLLTLNLSNRLLSLSFVFLSSEIALAARLISKLKVVITETNRMVGSKTSVKNKTAFRGIVKRKQTNFSDLTISLFFLFFFCGVKSRSKGRYIVREHL